MTVEPLRVLLVEDDEDDYVLTRDLLNLVDSFHVDLEWLPDPDRALGRLREGRHDLCIMDYRLGRRTGLEILEEAGSAGINVPIILLTGLGDRAVDLAAMRAGAADYLVKGELSPQTLDRSLRYVIQRKRSEEMLVLRRRNEALAEADRRKDAFLAMLAHELRNPLGALRNATTVLERSENAPERRARTLKVLSRQIGHLTRLVDDLLDVSRITQGKIILEPGPIDGAALLRDVVEDFAPQVRAQELRLETSLAPGPIPLMGDTVRLSQAVGNLLTNAIKFCEPGGVIRVGSEVDADANQLEISVYNSGEGIPPALRSEIFEPFVQRTQSLARTGGGLGVGLAMVKGLAQLHGGSIELLPIPLGEGTEFRLCLPISSALPEKWTSPTPAPAASAGAESRRILLVEDNPDVGVTMRVLLELMGHEVALAEEGETALSLARDFRPEVVLCDLGLPGMDGLDVARALRESPLGKDMRLIALSGYGRDTDVGACLAAGFEHHLVKPVEMEQLVKVLDGR
jgi:signal transduction histidine kinase